MAEHKKKKIVLFTAVFGKPDNLYDPTLPLPDVDKICYTDMKYTGQSCYNFVRIHLDKFPPTKRNRKIKICIPPDIFDEYRYSLYIDSTILLKEDPNVFLELFEPDSDIMMFEHPDRGCLYDEGTVCALWGKDDKTVIQKQLDKYRSDNYPTKNNLYATGVILRRHTERMREFSKLWWKEVQNYSHRDQISIPYIVWKYNIKVSIIPGNIWSNTYAQFGQHDELGSKFKCFT